MWPIKYLHSFIQSKVILSRFSYLMQKLHQSCLVHMKQASLDLTQYEKKIEWLLSFAVWHSAPVSKVANLIFYEIRLYFFNENESWKQLVLHWLSGCATNCPTHAVIANKTVRISQRKSTHRLLQNAYLTKKIAFFFILKPKTTAFCNLSCATSQLTYRFHHNPTCIPANFYCRIEY